MGSQYFSTETAPGAAAPTGYTGQFADSANLNRLTTVGAGGLGNAVLANTRYNYLVNGGMDFIQRFPVALTTNTQSLLGRQMNLDNWGLTSFVASGQAGRIDNLTTPIAGSVSRYYAQYKQITGAGKQAITQAIEYKDVANMRGKIVRFSIKIATGAWGSASALRMGLIQNNVSATADTIAAGFYTAAGANGTDPTLGTNLNYITPTLVESSAVTQPTIVGTAMQIVNPGASLTFTRYSATFLVPTTCVNLIVALWTDSQMSINDVLNLAEGSLTIGQEVVDWFPMSISEEDVRVKRYCQKTFALDTAPVQTGGLLGAIRGMVAIAGAVATSSTMQWQFPVRMRILPPTITFYNPSAGNAFVRNIPAATDSTVTATANTSDSALDINCTGAAGWTVGQELKVHAMVEAHI